MHTIKEIFPGAFGIPEHKSPATMDFHSKPPCVHRGIAAPRMKVFKRILAYLNLYRLTAARLS